MFALPTTTVPMEAKLAAVLPMGDGWQYEPKWDGFRCLAYRDGADVALMSKSGKPLDRFFPEVVAFVAGLTADRFVVDGELIIEVGGALAFDALQARLHPAASRILRLARETPARLMLFDCLAVGDTVLIDAPLTVRRAALERLGAGESESAQPTGPRLTASNSRNRPNRISWPIQPTGIATNRMIQNAMISSHTTGLGSATAIARAVCVQAHQPTKKPTTRIATHAAGDGVARRSTSR